MIIELRNQSIVELSFDGEDTTEEERNAAKSVVEIDARRNHIRLIKGLKFVFQNLSELLLSHNELGAGVQSFSHEEVVRMKKDCRNMPWNTSSPTPALVVQAQSQHVSGICTGLPSWIAALPATLRVLDISHNAISMFAECTCRNAADPLEPLTENQNRFCENELFLRYLRHISPNTISLFFSKLQFPVLEFLNISHNLLSSSIEEAKEAEEEWCRVLSQVSAREYDEEGNTSKESYTNNPEKRTLFLALESAVQELDLSWNEGIQCVNDFLLVRPFFHTKKQNKTVKCALRKLSLEHCGLNDFWGLSAVSYYAPSLEELNLASTSLALSVLQSSVNRGNGSENKEDIMKEDERKESSKFGAQWLRTALLHLATGKKMQQSSTIHRLPSQYLELVVDEIISNSALLHDFRDQVEYILCHKLGVKPTRRATASSENRSGEMNDSERGHASYIAHNCSYSRVLLTVLTHLVVQNLISVDQLSTSVCKETLLEAFHDVVRSLLKGNKVGTPQRAVFSSKVVGPSTGDTSFDGVGSITRKTGSTRSASTSQSGKGECYRIQEDHSYSYGEDHGLTATESSSFSSGVSHSAFSGTPAAKKSVISSSHLGRARSPPTELSFSMPSHSLKDEEVRMAQQKKLLGQAANLKERIDLSVKNQEKLVGEAKMLVEELELNRSTIAIQTKRILLLRERKRELISAIASNRAKARKRHVEVLHGLTALQFRLEKHTTPEKKSKKNEHRVRRNVFSAPRRESTPRRTRSEVLRTASAREKVKRFDSRHPFSYSPSRFRSTEKSARPSTSPVVSELSLTVEGDEKCSWVMPPQSLSREKTLEACWSGPAPLHPSLPKSVKSLLGDSLTSFSQYSSQYAFSKCSPQSLVVTLPKTHQELALSSSSLALPRMFRVAATFSDSSN